MIFDEDLQRESKMMSYVLSLLLIFLLGAHGHGDSVIYVNPEFNCDGYSNPLETHGSSCGLLGTAARPGYSCEHLKAACNKISGYYFVLSSGVFTKVYCEMDLSGGGWARYGKTNMASVWHYVDEDEVEITLEIINASDIKEMRELKYTRFLVQTDVVFKMQGDDSITPSRLTTRNIPWLEEKAAYIDGYANDHTRLEFANGRVDTMICRQGSSSKCGHGGTPSADRESKPFFFESLYFGPRAPGAILSQSLQNQWSRNKYTWNGTFYYVYAK